MTNYKKIGKKKPYEGHEIAYQRLRKDGFLFWDQKRSGTTAKSCNPDTYKFLKDVLSQPWSPRSGRVIELGCGTGPILRWICSRGFHGLGLDISKTAVTMAREQSKGLDIKFRQADVCRLDGKHFGKFDLVVDGLCLHCLTDRKDRKSYLAGVFRLLKDDGLFVLLTMCSPMNKQRFSVVCKGQRIVRKIVYVPCEDRNYAGLVKFDGRNYLATRYIGPWEDIIREVRDAGFEPKLIRYQACHRGDFCGTLNLAAVKKKGKRQKCHC